MRPLLRIFPLAAVAAAAACAAPPGVAVSDAQEARRLVMIAGRPSHPAGMHEHNAGVALLARCLRAVPGLQVATHYGGWPADPAALEGADAVLMYSDGGSRHMALQGDNLQALERLTARGAGLAALHYATEVPADSGGAQWKRWLGGHYETNYSVNPIWEAEYQALPEHPITRGVRPFSTRDEWYFSIRFRDAMQGVTPILQARPSDDVRDGPYVSPRGPYPHIMAANGQVETMAWAVERPDGGRGFGYTGGHYHENWGNESARKLVLNALLWISRVEVPENGVSCAVTPDDLRQNLDPK